MPSISNDLVNIQWIVMGRRSTAPSDNPPAGKVYFYILDDDSAYIKKSDGTTVALGGGGGGDGSPTGAVMDYAGATSPDGWLLCDGGAVSRTTYADLFGAIGVTYGAGDGTTTFNLPDLRGRVTAGKDDMGGTSANRLTDGWADTLGGDGGAEEHTLEMTELPSGDLGVARLAATRRRYTGVNDVIEAVTTKGFVNNSDLAGAGQAHNNVQPTVALNKIIKT